MIGYKFLVVCDKRRVEVLVSPDGVFTNPSGVNSSLATLKHGSLKAAVKHASRMVRMFSNFDTCENMGTLHEASGHHGEVFVIRAADVVTITVGKIADWQGVQGMHVARVLLAGGVCKFAVSGYSVRHVVENARQWADERGLFVVEEIVKG